ncbi:Metastasis suppressor protein 1 [Anas platyrhynchos]|uniref:Metastasis suppressor protein 1 n=1 Tax=Anas platyrhynchos TaxID=8839 RepID=R0L9E2_ANAPL|nr:Metastasis suppressor protein 1 [Anas platyrhynchos]
MEAVIEKECSALGGLFQTIISDMKVAPLLRQPPESSAQPHASGYENTLLRKHPRHLHRVHFG